MKWRLTGYQQSRTTTHIFPLLLRCGFKNLNIPFQSVSPSEVRSGGDGEETGESHHAGDR